jgi:hypothetical protein
MVRPPCPAVVFLGEIFPLIFRSFAFLMEWESRGVELQFAVELLHQV